MPYLLIQTNQKIEADQHADLLKCASAKVAELTGKPEKVIMVCLQSGLPMCFGQSSEPCAFIHLKSLGMSSDDGPDYVAGLCDFMRENLGISASRVFVQLSDHPRNMWGNDGRTYA